MPKPKFWGNFQNRAGIPLLFMALDGVGDHRALYHVPNNIIATLEQSVCPSVSFVCIEKFPY